MKCERVRKHKRVELTNVNQIRRVQGRTYYTRRETLRERCSKVKNEDCPLMYVKFEKFQASIHLNDLPWMLVKAGCCRC